MESSHFSSSLKEQELTHVRKHSSRRVHSLSGKINTPTRKTTQEHQMSQAQDFIVSPRQHALGGHVANEKEKPVHEYNGRDRLKRHREEVAGKVMIPEMWGQESLLKDWIDYSSFDKLLAPSGLASAREALVASSQRLRIESRC